MMHPNPIFRSAEVLESLAFVRARSFGVVAMNGASAPLLAHVPFLLNENANQADLHLLRSNPIVSALRDGPRAATLAVTGPDSYISPDWYEIDNQVPTWNYVAVHVTGTLQLQPTDTLRNVLDCQSALFEQQLDPKTPWTTSKMTPEILEKMMRAIVPVRLHVEDTQSTWKLSQNKPDEARLAAAREVGEHGIGSEIKTLAEWMKKPPANT